MKEHIEYLQYVEDKCLRCHSCRCYHSTSMIGSFCYGELATLLLQGKLEEFEKSICGCHQCGMCLKKCPRNFDAKEFMHHARALLENQNHDLCKIYQNIRVDQRENLFSKLKEENNIVYNDALQNGICKRLFIPGCHMSSSFPTLTNEVTQFLIDNDIVDGMSSFCCGNPLYASGLYKEFQTYISDLEVLYKKHGVQMITTPCPSCFDFYRRVQAMGYLEGIDIHCLSQDLVDHHIIINRAAFPEEYTVSIHDSCPDRKLGIFADSLRKLYQDFEIKELKHNHENSLCCGCGGLAPLYSQDVSAEGKQLKIDEVKEAHSDCLITTCFNCYKGLKPLTSIHQYLEDLMEGRQ